MSATMRREPVWSGNPRHPSSEPCPMLVACVMASFRRWLAIGALIATTAIAVSCKSDPATVEQNPEDPIVAARIDRVRIARGESSLEARPALPPHPTDPVDGRESSSESSSSSGAPSARTPTTGGASSGSSQGGGGGSGDGEGSSESAGEGGDSSGSGSGSAGGGEGGTSTGSPSRSSGATPSQSNESSPGSPTSTRAPTAAQVKVNQTGAASGSGSNAGEQGSGSGSGAGVEAPAAEGSDQRQSSGSQAASESESSGSSSEQGEEGDGSADDSGSGGETASQGSGAKTEAGGAGSGGGVGEQGRVEQSSSDHVQPETGSGGTQGGSNSTPGAPPTWLEPTAMEGSEAGGASGGSGEAGSGEARANDPASTSGSGGAEAGGLGEGRATATNEPAAPSGSLGVAQTADVAESADERDFLDAPLEVRDFPLEPSTTPEDPSTSPPDSSIETPSDVTSPESDDAAPVESAGSVDPRGPTSLDHEADDSGSEGSLEAAPARKQDASDSPKSPADDEPASTDRSRQGLAGESDQVRDSTVRQDSGASPASNDASDSSTRSGPGTSIGDESDADPALDEAESASRRASRIRIEIPQIDVEPIEARSLRDRSEHTLPDDPRWVLRGAWEQTNVRMNDADFAPGGYDRNLISIDPEEGLLRTYRVYGDGAYVAAGEFRVEIMPTGTLELRVDERRPHLFAAESFTISGETVTPPSEPIERPRQWSLRDGVLEIEGRRFVRLERQAFEAVARGDASDAGGIAADGGWEISPTSRVEDDPAPAVDFFGTSIVGRHICFVVDVSGSMAGPRLAAALGELARSIESLPSDRFFYVLFFSGSKLVLEDRWLRATPSSKRTFKSKLVGIEAQGGTEPSAALQHAFSSLAPVPDEIHFMTDGLIPQGIPELLRNLNAGRVRTVIHTYAFGERASEVMLEAIASEHGGRYRFVPE